MLNNIFLSFALFKLKGKFRGAAMTEYAILLAFIAVIASAFVFDWSQFIYNEDNTISGTSLGAAIYSAVLNAWSAIDRVGNQ